MIFPGFPGILSFFQVFQVFQVEWEPCNSNSNVDTENGFRPILSVRVCITIDAMLNFDGDVDANADVKCEQSKTDRIYLFKVTKFSILSTLFLNI